MSPRPPRILVSCYRKTLEEWIVAAVRSGHRVIHVSVHSFAPVLDGLERRNRRSRRKRIEQRKATRSVMTLS